MLELSDIKRDAEGNFYVRKYLGTNMVTGEPLRPYKRFPGARDEKEALVQAQDWYNTIARAVELHVAQRLDQLLYRYIDGMEARNYSPNTVKSYRTLVRRYVAPYIGAKDPGEVRPYDIAGLYNALLLGGAASGRGLSPATVITLHQFLSGAWKWMVSECVCDSDPMPSVEPPRPDVRESVALDAADFASLLETILDAICRPAVTTREVFAKNVMFAAYQSLMTGERCGEVCANVLPDFHWSAGYVHVGATVMETGGPPWRRKATKGRVSRNIAIDESFAHAASRFMVWQKSYLSPAVARDPHRALLLDGKGRMLRPSKVSGYFTENVVRELGLPEGTTFHSLRHTHATWLLVNGTDIVTVKERMGHADISTTLRIYAHAMPGRDAAAAGSFARFAEEAMGERDERPGYGHRLLLHGHRRQGR